MIFVSLTGLTPEEVVCLSLCLRRRWEDVSGVKNKSSQDLKKGKQELVGEERLPA